MSSSRSDVVIVGAGPVGLFAVFECGMLGMRCQVVDALDFLGGQLRALYPEKPIYDIPGYPCILAGELVERLVAQAAPFAPLYHLGAPAERLSAHEEGWRLEIAGGKVLEARAVIIAGGAGAFGPRRPPLAGIEAFEGKSVFYFVAKRDDFRGKRVVIAGGGDTALDWALSLAEVAEKIFLVHRREKFRGAPESLRRLHALAERGAVELVVPFQLHGLEGREGLLEAVRLRSLEGEERRLEADVLLPFFGLANDLGPIAAWGLDVRRHSVAVTPEACETGTPGIFAIGDIASYPGKLKLILTGFAEAAAAAHAIYKLVNPETELHWEYSTTKGLPGGVPGQR
jgi:thioredoxin reductase (NADPH)